MAPRKQTTGFDGADEPQQNNLDDVDPTEDAATADNADNLDATEADEPDGPVIVHTVPRPGSLEAVYERHADGALSRRVRKADSEG